MNFEKDKTNVLEEMNLLAEKVRAMQERFTQENSVVSNELQSIQERLQELIDTQKQQENLTAEYLKSSSEDFYDELDKQIEQIFKKGEDIWVSKRTFKNGAPPPFVSISQRPKRAGNRTTRFISLINFKGGVGKTTLTANLAAAFASGNYRNSSNQINSPPLRVLVVDLDFQGTLSDRCLENLPLFEAIMSKHTSLALLDLPKSGNITLEKLVLNIQKTDNAFIIPASDSLDSADNKHFVKLAFHRRDIRYCYRLWFHQKQVFESYDIVIFDCPPRKTTSSICALMASDFVFIPTAPESFDKYSVNRTINWLVRLKYQLDASFTIGGIILNRIQYRNKLTSLEIEFKNSLLQSIESIFSTSDPKTPPFMKKYIKENGTPTIFESYIPKRQGGNSVNGDRGELLPGSLQNRNEHPYFNEIATELYERIY